MSGRYHDDGHRGDTGSDDPARARALAASRAEGVAPPGWPAGVRPPGAPYWEDTAVAWLLDRCPPEFRGYSGLRRYPVVLARFAVLHVEAMQAAARRGLSEGRTALADVCDPDVVDKSIATWQMEQARLIGLRRSVGLVEEALRGRRFRARL